MFGGGLFFYSGGATRFVSCGVGDDNVARNDAEGTQETDFQAWLARCMTALGALAAKTQAEAAAASSSSSSGCCTNCNCQSSSSSSSSTPLSAEQEAEIMEDLAAEDDDEEEAPSGPLAKGAGEPLVDVEDMGNMMKGASGAAAGRKTRRPPRTKAQRKAAQAAAAAAAADGNVADDAADAADAAEVIDDENEDEEALVAAIASGAVTAREMVTPEIRKSLSKQGYRVIGSHSGVKLCRWTKAMLRYECSHTQPIQEDFASHMVFRVWLLFSVLKAVVVAAATSTRATASSRTRAWR